MCQVLYYSGASNCAPPPPSWSNLSGLPCPHTPALPVCLLLLGLFCRLFRVSDLGASLSWVLSPLYSTPPLLGAHSPPGFSYLCMVRAATSSQQLPAVKPEVLFVCQSSCHLDVSTYSAYPCRTHHPPPQASLVCFSPFPISDSHTRNFLQCWKLRSIQLILI